MQANRTRYLESLARELQSQCNRVRDLIGDKHWYSDGHQKEFLLRGILERHVPHGYLVSSGFVVSATDSAHCSREQDVLVVDTLNEAPIFNQGGLIIVFPEAVRAAISVKTQLTKGTLEDSYDTLRSVRKVAYNECVVSRIWNSAFFFEMGDTVKKSPILVDKYLADLSMKFPFEIPVMEDHGNLVPDMIVESRKYVYKAESVKDNDSERTVKLNAYDCGELATALWLSDLLDHLSFHRGNQRNSFADLGESVDFNVLSSSKLGNWSKEL